MSFDDSILDALATLGDGEILPDEPTISSLQMFSDVANLRWYF